MYVCNDFSFPDYDLCRVKILHSCGRNFFVDDNERKEKEEGTKRRWKEMFAYRYQFALRSYSNNLI